MIKNVSCCRRFKKQTQVESNKDKLLRRRRSTKISEEISFTMEVCSPQRESCPNVAHDYLDLNHEPWKQKSCRICSKLTRDESKQNRQTSETMTLFENSSRNKLAIQTLPKNKTHGKTSVDIKQKINQQCTPASIHEK